MKIKYKNIIYTTLTSALLASSSLALADTATGKGASDRASFDSASGKLHVPYVNTDLSGFERVSIDLFLGPVSNGNFIFSLDPSNDLHLIPPPPPHWAYEGEAGPEHWGDLTTDNIFCGSGSNQSPIDIIDNPDAFSENIKSVIPVNLNDISFNYSSTALNIRNSGHDIEVVYDAGSKISLYGKIYNLIQFHFHTPSEHTLNGSHVPMEIHLVHQSEEGALAVVGVLINAGAENPAFVDIIANIPEEEGDVETIPNTFVDANNLLPAVRNEYRYSGSLTTPPCSEGVQWLLLQSPIEMSQAQIDAFSTVMGNNSRPILPLNAREVLKNVPSN